MKKLTIIAALATAIVCLAPPSSTSAIWTDNHNHISSGQNPQIHSEGTLGFASQAGNIHCTNVTTTTQLTGGQTTAHINQLKVAFPQSQCHTEGALGHCTATIVQAKTPWVAHVNTTTGVQVVNVSIATDLHGFLCPDLTLESEDPATFQIELTGEEAGLVGWHTTIESLRVEGKGVLTPLETIADITGTFWTSVFQQHKYGWT